MASTAASPVAAACLIRLDFDVLLIRHRLSNKLDFPAGTINEGESAQCAAHREVWEETGLNVFVGELLTTTKSGMPVFNCHGEDFLLSLQSTTEPPYWATIEVAELVRVNPFDIEHDALRFGDDLTPLRDAFVAAGH